MENEKMVNPKEWSDFRATGLLFFINSILHAFGWAIVVEVNDKDGSIEKCYPARVKFRGFDEKSQEEEHRKIGNYLAETAEQLKQEANS